MNLQPQKIIPLIDLTSLNDTDTPEIIYELCRQALTPYGNVAAVCVYPKFVALAKHFFEILQISLSTAATPKIATVANFSSGFMSISEIQQQIKVALPEGADEIDLVMPYQDYLAGQVDKVFVTISACHHLCKNNALLKVILETGVLQDPQIIQQATELCIQAGADFIKTSTGKVVTGATLAAAESILEGIKTAQMKLNRTVGIKISGGIRTYQQANEYLSLISRKMGSAWISSSTVRFGASQLLGNLIKIIEVEAAK